MYLPTFWKLTTEATMYRIKHMSGYTIPVTVLSKWNYIEESIYFTDDYHV